MKATPIPAPLPGEHLVGIWPTPKPDATDEGPQRLHFWSGRALTAEALQLEQNSRAERLACRGRVATPGIITGLGVGLEGPEPTAEEPTRKGHIIHLLPGYGVTAAGEDVLVPRALAVKLEDVEIVNPDSNDAQAIPWAAVLVLRPAEIRSFAKLDEDDPCQLDLSLDAFQDQRRLEAARLQLYVLPIALRDSLPNRGDKTWRNRLAASLFSTEASESPRQQIRRSESPGKPVSWDVALTRSARGEWEKQGLPLALLSIETDPGPPNIKRIFLDRSSVARAGALPHARSRPAVNVGTNENAVTFNPPGFGTPALWRARVDQFAEQLSEFLHEEPSAQAAHFRYLPPAGLLSRGALTFLNTKEAKTLQPIAHGAPAPDRADRSLFFPATYDVHAVPVAAEDLDAALTVAAPLVPFDLEAKGEEVRVFVPIPQRVFDPNLLIVELPDLLFSDETNRFAALRQDWRERRDYVIDRHAHWSQLLTGVKPQRPPDTTQLEEVEPIEAPLDSKALLSPISNSGALEVSMENPLRLTDAMTLLVRLHLDVENAPAWISFGFILGDKTYRATWTPDQFPKRENIKHPDDPAPRFELWEEWPIPVAALGLSGEGDFTTFTVQVEGGRIALAGLKISGVEKPIWSAGDAKVEMTGGDWTSVADTRLDVPFEDRFDVVFTDKDLDVRRKELNEAANPAKVDPRKESLSVEKNGLRRVVDELDAEAREADDFVDAHFTRAQTNLYRVRKLVLGESAAQKLLINPAVATIVEQETATATAEKLSSYLEAAKLRKLEGEAFAKVKASLKAISRAQAPGEAAPAEIVIATAVKGKPNVIVKPLEGWKDPVITKKLDPKKGIDPTVLGKIDKGGAVDMLDKRKADPKASIRGDLPETGPTMPTRGIGVGKRFEEAIATLNLSYARAALQEVVEQLPQIRLALLEEEIRSLNRVDRIALLDLQGRAISRENLNPKGLREKAFEKLFELPQELQDNAPAEKKTTATDEAEVTLLALDMIEIKSAILRLIERVIERRRAIVETGRETIEAVEERMGDAQIRYDQLQARLTEARQDVSVARALWREEISRTDGINERRDSLLANEVKFLAYARPRTIDPARRSLGFWRLELEGAPAPLPACLRRHDEPPDPLHAYVQLFRHAPVGWFPEMARQLDLLDTHEKLANLILTTDETAPRFLTAPRPVTFRTGSTTAVLATYQSAFSLVQASREQAVTLTQARVQAKSWLDHRRDAETQSSLGDLLDGRHRQPALTRAAAEFFDSIEQVATCLHAEFAAVPPAVRLTWIERYSQFDRPAPLRDLTVLPGYGRLPRDQRRRFQDFINWLFDRVVPNNASAFSLINDLVRMCLLLASHAPVNQIITGHLPRPVPVRPGALIPIRPASPPMVRVGMEFHIWRGPALVAQGRVEDLNGEEVTARVLTAQAATLDSSMRVQFVPAALGIIK